MRKNKLCFFLELYCSEKLHYILNFLKGMKKRSFIQTITNGNLRDIQKKGKETIVLKEDD